MDEGSHIDYSTLLLLLLLLGVANASGGAAKLNIHVPKVHSHQRCHSECGSVHGDDPIDADQLVDVVNPG